MARFTGFAGGAFVSFEQASTGSTETGSTDDVADAFVFADQFNVALSSTRTSNTITVSGLGSTVSVASVLTGSTSSQQSINGGAFQSSDATVVNSDQIVVKHVASASGVTQVDTTLTLGSTVSDTFSSVTASTVVGGSITPIAVAVLRRRFN